VVDDRLWRELKGLLPALVDLRNEAMVALVPLGPLQVRVGALEGEPQVDDPDHERRDRRDERNAVHRDADVGHVCCGVRT